MARRLALLALALVALFVATAAPASALVQHDRYASPQGTSSDPCTADHPCDADKAISGAGSDVDVYLYADRGPYAVTTAAGLELSGNNARLHGLNGRARLIGNGSGPVLVVENGSNAEGLYVEDSSPADPALAVLGSNAIDVIVKSSGGSAACYLDGGILKDSVCWASSVTPDGAAQTDDNVTFRNVTIEATGGGNSIGLKSFSRHSDPSDVSLVNTIARGAPGGWDVYAESDGTHSLSISQDHSDYGNKSKGTHYQQVSLDDPSTTAVPDYVAGTAGDFHQACGSPTIDAGVNDMSNGQFDFDGDARLIGAATDIGADELTAGPAAGGASASGIGLTTATLKGAVNPRGCATSWHFDYGTSTLSSHTPAHSLTVGSTAKPVSAALSGLAPNTTYKFQLVASSATGTAKSAVGTFKTPPDPFTGVVLGTKGKVKKGKARVRVACPAAVPGPCVGTLKLKSAKKVGKKKLTVGKATFSIAAGEGATVKVKLSKKARAYFKNHKKLAASASALAHDALGTATTANGKVKLTRAKKKKKH